MKASEALIQFANAGLDLNSFNFVTGPSHQYLEDVSCGKPFHDFDHCLTAICLAISMAEFDGD